MKKSQEVDSKNRRQHYSRCITRLFLTDCWHRLIPLLQPGSLQPSRQQHHLATTSSGNNEILASVDASLLILDRLRRLRACTEQTATSQAITNLGIPTARRVHETLPNLPAIRIGIGR
jgi:hypothetical protein